LESRPLTLNEHYYTDYREKFTAHYKSWRQQDKNPMLMKAIRNQQPHEIFFGSKAPTQSPIAKIMSGLAELGLHVSTPELAKLIQSDPMETALDIMAGLRAYFQGKRIRSIICNVEVFTSVPLYSGIQTFYG
jgi:hypothetical protein